jgi:hypothetical protein
MKDGESEGKFIYLEQACSEFGQLYEKSPIWALIEIHFKLSEIHKVISTYSERRATSLN